MVPQKQTRRPGAGLRDARPGRQQSRGPGVSQPPVPDLGRLGFRLLQVRSEWYLRNKQGGLVLDYATPALDASGPEVLAFLKRLFQTLDDWGFDYYKFDGEHALPRYIPAVDRTRLARA